MKRLITTLLLTLSFWSGAQTTVQSGQTLEIIKISQFPLLTGGIPTNALFLLAIPGQGNNSIYAAPLANGLQTLQSNYTTISNLLAAGPTTGVAIQDGYTFSPVTVNTGSNTYWIDFGKTNKFGQNLVNATISATNDVVFYGTTNINRQWQCLSYNIISASAGSFIRVWIPTNGLQLFSTNYGPNIFYPSNNYYYLTLTNGHLFRDSMQTNNILEHQWIVK